MPLVTAPLPKMSPRRPKAGTRVRGHVSLPFPRPSPGETVMVGAGDWAGYLRLDEVCQKTGMRVRFHRGIIEVMSISFPHESLKHAIGRMVVAWCDRHSMDYNCWGSTTQRIEGIMGGEPDDSFSFGEEMKPQPDLFIELALSSGGIDKLEFWSEIRAREVWVWQNSRLHAYALVDGGYEVVTESRVLPGIPFKLVEELADLKPHSRAVREFQKRCVA